MHNSYFVGVALAGAIFYAIGWVSGFKNDIRYLDDVGAGKFARAFWPACFSEMDKERMSFRYGSPTPKYGCICVGVRMEQKFPEQVATGERAAGEAFADYMEYIRHRETSRRASNLPWITEVPEAMKTAVRKSFHYCDEYTLKGLKRVDMSHYPEWRKDNDNKFFLLARESARMRWDSH